MVHDDGEHGSRLRIQADTTGMGGGHTMDAHENEDVRDRSLRLPIALAAFSVAAGCLLTFVVLW